MKKAIHVIIPLVIACAIYSCAENKEISSRLQVAEGLMDYHPDSALFILNGIKTSEKLSEKQNALWCLLTTQAQDKTGAIHTSDSLIQIAVRYYEKKKDRGNRMKAYYYNAVVLYRLGDSPYAQDFYLKALEAGKKSEDHALLGRIYANLGTLYLYQDMIEEALKYQIESVKHFTAIKDTTNIGLALRNIGRVYINNKQLDSAIIYYTQSLNYVTDKSRLSIHNDVASLYNQMENYPEAFMHIRLAMGALKSGDEELPLYYNLGDLYRQAGQYDSAFYYLYPCLTSDNIYTKAGANLGLAFLEEKRKNWETYATYLSHYLNLQDSISNMERSENLQHIQSLYNYQLVEKDRLFHEMESRKKTTYLYLLSVAFISILIAAVFYYLRRKRISKERMNKALLIQEQKHRQSRKYVEEKEDEIRRLKDAYDRETDKLKKELLAARQQMANKDIEQLKQMRTLQKEKKEEFKKSPLLQSFTTDGKPTHKNWAELETWMELIYPEMIPYLKKEIPNISDEKLKVCYLLMIGLKGKRMSELLNVSQSAISQAKKRLYEDLGNKGRGAAEFDIFLFEMFDKN